MKEEEKYCRGCGIGLKERENGYFNTLTGEKSKVTFCPNELCPRKCLEGHLGFVWGKCTRCGESGLIITIIFLGLVLFMLLKSYLN